ncbi:hypothetical protein EW146_g8767 [Bondarzewia mesenterica]|uniref:Uncharacterized protein n=1 Tax=Bondarzewia mesenterica TaxID=1095465 RepID=A0A4S4LDH7_9AGAM|nr:hypothetical protein EW146_g8767 [Bondarzewia mesenterica]
MDPFTLTPDQRFMASNADYVAIPEEHCPPSVPELPVSSSVTASYYISEGWVWRAVGATRQRLFWVPVEFRPEEFTRKHATGAVSKRLVMAVHQNTLVVRVQSGQLVVMDMSALLR